MECSSDKLMCSTGASGPLCGSCLTGYALSAVNSVCVACGEATLHAYITIGVFFGLITTATALYWGWVWLPLWLRGSWIAGTLQQLDGGKYKITWSTLQIVGSVSVSLSIEWPPIFQDFLRLLSVLSFDFLSADCIGDSPTFYRTVIVWSITPVAAVGLLGLSFCAQSAQYLGKTSSEVARMKIHSSHLTYFIVLTYLVLPPVLLKQ